MTKDDEAYSARRAVAFSTFGMTLLSEGGVAGATGQAIDSAMRVEITAEVVTAMLTEVDKVGVQHDGIEMGLAAAFRAAGFEVVP